MKTSLCAGAVLLALTLTACGGGDDGPAASGDSPSASATDSPGESAPASPGESPDAGSDGLPIPAGAICAGLDVADLSEAIGTDLEVRADLVVGETSPVSGIAVLAPQCSLAGGGKALDLAVFANDEQATLSDDVDAGIAAAEQAGALECRDVRDVDGAAFDGRESVGYDCEVSSSEVDATTVVVRMAPQWRVQCALTGPDLPRAASRTQVQDACAAVVDSLAG